MVLTIDGSPEDDDEIRDALFCALPEKAAVLGRPGPFFFSLDSLVRRDEACWLIGSVEDVAIIQIVGVAVAALTRHYYGLPIPEEPKLQPGVP